MKTFNPPPLKGIKLLACDIDNTLVDRDSSILYSHIKRWFEQNPEIGKEIKLALITNQGGPACHDAGWSNSKNFPSLNVTKKRLEKIINQLPEGASLFVTYAYVSKKGKVLIPNQLMPLDPLADPDRRKPSPKMILEAMDYFEITDPKKVLFVGDRREDSIAARKARVKFHCVKNGVSSPNVYIEMPPMKKRAKRTSLTNKSGLKKNRLILKGTTYYEANTQYRLHNLEPGSKLILEPQPDNPYDRYAVAVKLKQNKAMLGHISRGSAKKYSLLCLEKKIVDAEIINVQNQPDEPLKITISVTAYDFFGHDRKNNKLSLSIEKLKQEAGVYLIRRTDDKGVYVGSTANYKRRAEEHKANLFNISHPNYPLLRDFIEAGPDCFVFEIAQSVISLDDLEELEQVEIENQIINGEKIYNLTDDGKGRYSIFGGDRDINDNIYNELPQKPSTHKERRDLVWNRIIDIYNKGEAIPGVINYQVQGGFAVKFDSFEAYLPNSHVDLSHIDKFQKYIGSKSLFKIIKIKHETKEVVVSRKVLLGKKQSAEKINLLSNLTKGMEIEGIITNIRDSGLYVNVNGIGGICHISDMPSQINSFSIHIKYSKGQSIKATILKIDQEKQILSLGIKQLDENVKYFSR